MAAPRPRVGYRPRDFSAMGGENTGRAPGTLAGAEVWVRPQGLPTTASPGPRRIVEGSSHTGNSRRRLLSLPARFGGETSRHSARRSAAPPRPLRTHIPSREAARAPARPQNLGANGPPRLNSLFNYFALIN